MGRNSLGRAISLQLVFWPIFSSISFTVVFLRSRGLDATTIGTLMAVYSLITIIAQPIWGLASDRLRSVKKVFILCLSTAALLYGLLPLTHAVMTTAILLGVCVFFRAPIIALLDTYVVEQARQDPSLQYGIVRMWGAVSYAPMVFLYGWLIQRASVDVIFVGYVLFSLATIALFSRVREPVPPERPARLGIGRLFGDPRYLAFLIFAVMAYMPVSATFTFAPHIVESVGGGSEHLGLIFFVRAASEIPAFIASRRYVKRSNFLLMVLAGTFGYVIQMYLYMVVDTVRGLVLIQLIRGPAFAFFVTGAVYYVRSLAPEELKATAQSTARSFYMGISGMIGSLGGGWLVDNYGVASLYRWGLLVSVLGHLFFFFSILIARSSLRRRSR